MKRILTVAALSLVVGSLAFGDAALAQPRHEPPHANAHNHHDWHKGGRIDQNDWKRGRHVDYRQHHLKAPPRGYEWRDVDGDYVLAAVATGVIASIILNN